MSDKFEGDFYFADKALSDIDLRAMKRPRGDEPLGPRITVRLPGSLDFTLRRDAKDRELAVGAALREALLERYAMKPITCRKAKVHALGGWCKKLSKADMESVRALGDFLIARCEEAKNRKDRRKP